MQSRDYIIVSDRQMENISWSETHAWDRKGVLKLFQVYFPYKDPAVFFSGETSTHRMQATWNHASII